MALVNVVIPARTITDEANDIREKLAQVLALADIRLTEIRNIVREHTRAAIAAELGADAADLLAVFNSLKDAVETGKDKSIEVLP